MSDFDEAQFSHLVQEALYLVVVDSALADIKRDGNVVPASTRRDGSLREDARLFHISVGGK